MGLADSIRAALHGAARGAAAALIHNGDARWDAEANGAAIEAQGRLIATQSAAIIQLAEELERLQRDSIPPTHP